MQEFRISLVSAVSTSNQLISGCVRTVTSATSEIQVLLKDERSDYCDDGGQTFLSIEFFNTSKDKSEQVSPANLHNL